MRVVGIVSKLAAPAGVYAREGVDVEKFTRGWDERVTAITEVSAASAKAGAGPTAGGIWAVAAGALLVFPL